MVRTCLYFLTDKPTKAGKTLNCARKSNIATVVGKNTATKNFVGIWECFYFGYSAS